MGWFFRWILRYTGSSKGDSENERGTHSGDDDSGINEVVIGASIQAVREELAALNPEDALGEEDTSLHEAFTDVDSEEENEAVVDASNIELNDVYKEEAATPVTFTQENVLKKTKVQLQQGRKGDPKSMSMKPIRGSPAKEK